MLGAVDLRASGWLWRDVAGPGLENVDERLLRASVGIGNWNQLTPRLTSATSSVMGWAPDIAQGSSFARISDSASPWSEGAWKLWRGGEMSLVISC